MAGSTHDTVLYQLHAASFYSVLFLAPVFALEVWNANPEVRWPKPQQQTWHTTMETSELFNGNGSKITKRETNDV